MTFSNGSQIVGAKSSFLHLKTEFELAFEKSLNFLYLAIENILRNVFHEGARPLS
jgi:hypothetical protein